MWWIGDWLCFGERTYGAAVEAAEMTGFAHKTCQEAKYVASSVEPSMRMHPCSVKGVSSLASL